MPAPPILETHGLGKDFGEFTAVADVSLSVQRGSIHALIGPNGAGKTTCFNLLTRFLPASRGTILFDGKDITHAAPHSLARQGMVRSFQISSVFPQLTCHENIRMALIARSTLGLQFWRGKAALAHHQDKTTELLQSVGLDDAAHHIAGDLPYGKKRALELATTLATEPSLLLLDEPTQGMGHEDIGPMMQLIRRVAHGRTVLMVEHNMKVVQGLCDTITVMARGSVLAQGNFDQVSRHPLVLEAYLGSAPPPSTPTHAPTPASA
jgi:branched-chain amino acid transport system ATP-binding protein